MMHSNINIPENEIFLTEDSKQLISEAVYQLMLELRAGKSLADVIANLLCVGVTADENSDLPDYLQGGIEDSHNNAYFAAEYIINRVTDQDSACGDCCADLESGVRDQLEELIKDCNRTQAIRRLHEMKSCLEIANVALSNKFTNRTAETPAVAINIPPYDGGYEEADLKKLMDEVTDTLTSLTLSEDLLRRYTKAIKAGGDAFITCENYTEECIEIKSITSAVLYLLARKNLLPEVADDVMIDNVISSVCLWTDMQIIANTVREGQEVFDATKALLNCALIASITALFVILIKTGTMEWLTSLLLANTATLIIAIIAAFIVGPVIVSAISDAENKIASRAANFTVEHGMSPVRYAFSTAKDRMVGIFEKLTGMFKRSAADADASETEHAKPAAASEDVFDSPSVNA